MSLEREMGRSFLSTIIALTQILIAYSLFISYSQAEILTPEGRFASVGKQFIPDIRFEPPRDVIHERTISINEEYSVTHQILDVGCEDKYYAQAVGPNPLHRYAIKLYFRDATKCRFRRSPNDFRSHIKRIIEFEFLGTPAADLVKRLKWINNKWSYETDLFQRVGFPNIIQNDENCRRIDQNLTQCSGRIKMQIVPSKQYDGSEDVDWDIVARTFTITIYEQKGNVASIFIE